MLLEDLLTVVDMEVVVQVITEEDMEVVEADMAVADTVEIVDMEVATVLKMNRRKNNRIKPTITVPV